METEFTYGVLSLFPAIFLIVASIWSKRVIEPLALTAVFCTIIYAKLGFVDALVASAAAQWKAEASTYIIVLLMGSLIVIMQASGGANALGIFLARYCNNHNKSVIGAWLLGCIIFLNSYMTALAINASMKGVCDKNKVPREMLSYVIDSTSVPATVMIPVTPMALFYGGVLI
jgi:Na+/H+ antiporter NhaC